MPNTPGIDTSEDRKASLTHHFIAALIACGYTAGQRLEKALAWFIDLNPQPTFGHMDMNRLEALLQAGFHAREYSFAPPHDQLSGLLQRLLDQRDNDTFYIDDLSAQSAAFANLWAIKVLNTAAGQGFLDPAVCDQLRACLASVNGGDLSFLAHKDVALALNLQYRLHGQLEPRHRQALARLLKSREEGGGLWGVNPASLRSQVPQLLRHGFDPALIGSHERNWRMALVATCYVIENLAALREECPEVRGPAEKALNQIMGLLLQDPLLLDDVQQHFVSEHGYIQIVCRLLAAAGAWWGSLQSFIFPHLVDGEGRQRRLEVAEKPSYAIDEEGITDTLRKWIEVTHNGKPEALTRGLSGARVVRVWPRLAIPSTELHNERRQVQLAGIDSLVVKYGPHQLIDAEIRNYQTLPARLRAKFVTIPDVIHRNEAHAFIVIQDLLNFEALEQFLPRSRQQGVAEILGDELASFLRDFHLPELDLGHPAPVGLARHLYMEPTWRYLGTVFSLLNEPPVHGFFEEVGASAVQRAQQIEVEFRKLLTELYSYEGVLNRFHSVYMHGDLHARNIMIRVTGNVHAPLDIRLIDLENVTPRGDYAYDVGELRTSLSLIERESGDVRQQSLVSAISEQLRATYQEVAEKHKDETFAVRLNLAECRAWLRVAHGKSKEGRHNLEGGKLFRATNIVRDALKLVEAAHRNLSAALESLAGEGRRSGL